MQEQLLRGANIIINHWIGLKKDDKLCIVSSQNHSLEIMLLEQVARKVSQYVEVMLVETDGKHVGTYFDEHPNVFDPFDIVIGATDYSIVTTKACDKLLENHKKFLSLPLSTNNHESMLGFDFLSVDTTLSRIKAEILLKYLENCQTIHVKTDLGTDLTCSMKDRHAGFFNGTLKDNHAYSSSSVEVYIPIVETMTNGQLVVDGSLGYIGKVDQPIHIQFQQGKIIAIENHESGKKLQSYLESFHDKQMYVAGEFGIGLNPLSKCVGRCYIEDESAYGTFHIGMGRNIGLNGVHAASGHFDLVICSPTIWVDNRMIMQNGEIIIPEFEAISAYM